MTSSTTQDFYEFLLIFGDINKSFTLFGGLSDIVSAPSTAKLTLSLEEARLQTSRNMVTQPKNQSIHTARLEFG